MRKVPVFAVDENPQVDRPLRLQKKGEAIDLVSRGKAFFLNLAHLHPLAIQLKQEETREVKLQSKQGPVYESCAAAKPQQRLLQGGLTRTETQPHVPS